MSSSVSSNAWREEVAVVEMLVEAYFMHLDSVYNRLNVCVCVTCVCVL